MKKKEWLGRELSKKTETGLALLKMKRHGSGEKRFIRVLTISGGKVGGEDQKEGEEKRGYQYIEEGERRGLRSRIVGGKRAKANGKGVKCWS